MKNSSSRQPRGFALIITVALMVLLSLLAVGLLSLSTITLRGSSQLSALAEARANARMAMVLAIGRLQKEFGPDQRISASGSILGGSGEVANAHWLGSWDSWRGDNRHLSDQHDDDDLVPDISENRSDSFRRWLVSSPDPEDLESIDAAEATSSDESILLVGSGTLGNNNQDSSREVRAPQVFLSDDEDDGAANPGESSPTGAYTWWIGDESQKGVVRAGRDEEELEEPGAVLAEVESPSSIAEEMYDRFGNEPSETEELARGSVSRRTLDLLSNAGDLGAHYHDLSVSARSILADVREGGLKKDLNLLAERYNANFDESDGLPVSEEFMMYDFGELHRVSLHDLLTYYSLYKARPDGSRGALVSDGRSKPYVTNISSAEWSADRDGLTTNLYRQPVLLKMQLVVSARAERSGPTPDRPYRLKLRFTPIITFWNPYNVPLTLNGARGDGTVVDLLGVAADIAVWKPYGSNAQESSSLGGMTTGAGDDAGGSNHLATMRIRDQVEFDPGEVRVFSLDAIYDDLTGERELVPGYNPLSGNEIDYYDLRTSRGGAVGATEDGPAVTFREGETVGIGFGSVAQSVELKFNQGVAFEVRPDYPGSDTGWRTQALYSRRTTDYNVSESVIQEIERFNRLVFELGSRLDGDEITHSQTGSTMVRQPYNVDNLDSPQGEIVGVFTYGISGEEEATRAHSGGQPRFPARPFLHSLPTANSPWIQDLTTAALYNLGWSWRIEDGSEASNDVVVDGQNSLYGGGWSAANGQRRVVQFELPQRPFHAMAKFANAALGGWSIARRYPSDSNAYGTASRLYNHETTTALGQGGLFPAVSKAIGNSYAHPMLGPDEAIGTWNTRKYENAFRTEPFVDHSYLANYALWDEYFMSSIADQSRGLYASSDLSGRTAVEMATEFFGPEARSLPHHRLEPRMKGSWDDLESELFPRGGTPGDDAYEIIARYLLLEGGFNVNSTSVDAWKTLFASLRNKPTLVLPGESDGLDFNFEQHEDETPVPSPSVATGESISADAGSRSDPFAPEQWVGSFTLDDDQVERLAEAMVEEVRRRGPFLSLSDFINRRLSGDTELAKVGALQAAIDQAGLNSQVDASRSVDTGERSAFMREMGMRDSDPIQFPAAARGSAIRGSSAYIDQADVLRAIDSQLVPRGDTFVIRTCGQSMDAAGNVVASAYCEAVVQRMPEYLEGEDEPEFPFDELSSEINRSFGRRIELVSFRWLSNDEI